MADPWLLALCVAGPVAIWVAGRSRGRRAGVAVLAVMAVFLLAKAALGIGAFSNYREARDRSGEIVLARAIEAKWASLNTWHVFDRTANHVRVWSAGSDGAHEEFVVAARAGNHAGQRLPIALHRAQFSPRARPRVRRDAASRRRAAPWCCGRTSDSVGTRRRPTRARWSQSFGPLPVTERIACALWFGGELDADGRPQLEIVKVGRFTQTRAPDE